MISQNLHPVAQKLLKRQNKSAPFKDGRKITLILPGGLMTGVLGAGAIVGLYELGLKDAFDEIHVISAGIANASYFLANQPRLGVSIYYEDCAQRKFINILRPWKIVNIDYLIDVFEKVKPLNIKKVLGHPTKLYVRLSDLKNKKVVYVKSHDIPDNQYLRLMEAALSIPYLHPGSTKINGTHYKDPGYDQYHLPDHIDRVLQSDATDIVIVYNHLGQVRSVHKALSLPLDRVLEIVPRSEWQLNKFETNADKLKHLSLQMGYLTKTIFGKDQGINLEYYDRD